MDMAQNVQHADDGSFGPVHSRAYFAAPDALSARSSRWDSLRSGTSYYVL